MKFEKLEIKNFKPYRNVEIPLYDINRSDKNMSLNLGQTGAGKTSISEAILWCLYGDLYLSKKDGMSLAEWVNKLEKEIAIRKGVKSIPINVSLSIIMENNEKYKLIRSSKYIVSEEKVNKSKFNIVKNGEPIDDSGFINKYFVSRDLMEYFIFDADEVLDDFEKDRKGTIRKNIYDLIGIEIFDTIKEQLINLADPSKGYIQELIDKKKTELQTEEVQNSLKTLRKIKANLERNIKETEKKKKNLKKKKNEIFGGEPSPDVLKFSKLKDKEEQLNTTLEKIVKKYKTRKIEDYKHNLNDRLVKNLDFLFLDGIIKSILNKLEKFGITKSEYENSKSILLSLVEDEFRGIYLKSNNMMLIKKSVDIKDVNLEEESRLKSKVDFEKNNINYREVRQIIDSAIDCSQKVYKIYQKYKDKYKATNSELIEIKNEIKKLQNTAEREEDREKLKKYENLEKQIIDINEEISDYKTELENTIDDIEEEEKKLEISKETEEEIKDLLEEREKINSIISIIKKAKSNFTGDLLSEINTIASTFLKDVTSKKRLYNTIKVSSDYSFQVYSDNGNKLTQHQFNKGNKQVCLMSFFISIAKYLSKNQNKRIPYIIDNPIFRLDPGYDKRLLDKLKELPDQIILHLIPEKEYRPDKFDMFSVNIQNWINISRDRESEIENKSPTKPITYDIDEF